MRWLMRWINRDKQRATDQRLNDQIYDRAAARTRLYGEVLAHKLGPEASEVQQALDQLGRGGGERR